MGGRKNSAGGGAGKLQGSVRMGGGTGHCPPAPPYPSLSAPGSPEQR